MFNVRAKLALDGKGAVLEVIYFPGFSSHLEEVNCDCLRWLPEISQWIRDWKKLNSDNEVDDCIMIFLTMIYKIYFSTKQIKFSKLYSMFTFCNL